jgi:hypothetical protein
MGAWPRPSNMIIERRKSVKAHGARGFVIVSSHTVGLDTPIRSPAASLAAIGSPRSSDFSLKSG